MQINNHYLKKMYTWLLPFICILCGQPAEQNQDLCRACHKMLPLLIHGCPCCAIPLPDSAAGFICGQCLQTTPPFNITHALYCYELPITKLILELKFNQALVNARLLGELLAAEIQQKWYRTSPLPSLIIPMPLHKARLKERGFNQALEIARPIANMLNLPIHISHCHRRKLTQPQTMLSAAERRKNVKGAFIVTKNFSGQHVAVIDDVITTGSTMVEFCKSLKQQGAARIDVWCCARAGHASD